MCYTTDESQKHAKCNKPVTKGQILYDSGEAPKVVKFVQSRMVVARMRIGTGKFLLKNSVPDLYPSYLSLALLSLSS